MIELRRMTKTDQLNYNGESFRDGCLPLIGEFRVDGQKVVAIADDWGLSLILEAGKETRVSSTDALNILFQINSRMSKESIREILSNYCCRLEL